jgi:hypothetical protein
MTEEAMVDAISRRTPATCSNPSDLSSLGVGPLEGAVAAAVMAIPLQISGIRDPVDLDEDHRPGTSIRYPSRPLLAPVNDEFDRIEPAGRDCHKLRRGLEHIGRR